MHRTIFAMIVAAFFTVAEANDSSPVSAQPVIESDIRSDFAFLYATLNEAHYDLYVHRPKVEYDACYQQLASTIHPPMTRLEATIMFQKFVAYGKIGHARIDAPIVEFVTYLHGGGTMLPLFIRVDGKKVLLTEAAEASGTLKAGVQIVALNGIPVEQMLQRLSAHVSSERPYMTYTQMEKSFPALLWLELGRVSSVSVTAMIGKHAVTVPVQAVTLDQRRALAKSLPTARPGTDFATREYKALGNGIAYLRPGPFFNITQAGQGPAPSYELSEFRTFIDESFGKILSSGATDLIIDLRNNPGGDNSFSDPMIAWFANRPFRFASSFMLKASAATKADYARQKAGSTPVDPDLSRMMDVEAQEPNGTRYRFDLPVILPHAGPRFPGRVWVLVNRHSYSNAASVAALVQDYRFGKILGEETADVASNFASVQHFSLPATGITVTYPKSHFIRPNGKDGLSGVIPDIPLQREPIGVEKDTVLDLALKRIRGAH